MKVFNSNDFPELKIFEDRFADIREEVLSLDRSRVPSIHEPYLVKTGFERDATPWKVAFLWTQCREINNGAEANRPEYHSRIPVLSQALREFGRVALANISIYEPGASIGPHRNFINFTYRAHLGVKIPRGDLGLRVEDVKIKWEEGRILGFDQCLNHESWNFTGEDRWVIIIDFLRPGRTSEEKQIRDWREGKLKTYNLPENYNVPNAKWITIDDIDSLHEYKVEAESYPYDLMEPVFENNEFILKDGKSASKATP